MNPPLPPEREVQPRERLKRREAPKGRACPDKAYDPVPTSRSRELRNNATSAERALWNALKNRQLGGARFNRQVVIRPYICDLVARSAKLVIEIDDGQHGETVTYDRARTGFLKFKGYRVLRFWNNDVLENLEGVVKTIEQALANCPSRLSGRGRAFAESEGEGLLEVTPTSPPPLASRVDPSSSGGRGEQQ